MAQANKRALTRERKPLTQDRLKELLYYNPETGIFIRRIDRIAGAPCPRWKAGTVAGCTQRARGTYITIRIDGILYPAHKLAWLYMTGNWADLIDHRDLDGLNNRFGNLRPATKSQNAVNTRAPKTNKSGFKGVHFSKSAQKWVSKMRRNNKVRYLGTFDTPEAAHKAYCAESTRLDGEFSRTK